jgi:2-hydroxychromene-2-carboxylate isomerase
MLLRVLAGLGVDAERVLAHADSDEIRKLYGEQTDAARMLGIFGSPTLVVGSELFWGDDRMEDAMDWLEAQWAQATERAAAGA